MNSPQEPPLLEIVAEVKAALGVETKSMAKALSEILKELGLPDEGTSKEKAHRAALELSLPIYMPFTDASAGLEAIAAAQQAAAHDVTPPTIPSSYLPPDPARSSSSSMWLLVDHRTGHA